ncbi:protein hupE [Skermanella stibiiresistens SB22]|uniref:Protein hupE n=1 Tax=Skermanella stibiiresistens SB22 TaxID=1385369 RepID=W9GW48_9PROT|nr:HupE/UreJ family protein [Skermanella stibiiresistens]EWY38110.1 protein hupE [Skermanella stibiiresistens SB22]
MRRTGLGLGLAAAALTVMPVAAMAHPGHMELAGFPQGLGHPFGGLDHLLAIVAVGLWAAQLGGRALWALPLSFVGAMVLGGLAGMAGLSLPSVEIGILGSVLVLGGLVAFQARLPLVASATITALLAVFHGYAHGAEMPAAASPLAYGLGFVVATALLHAVGIGAIMAIRAGFKSAAGQMAVRGTGALVGFGGLALALLG